MSRLPIVSIAVTPEYWQHHFDPRTIYAHLLSNNAPNYQYLALSLLRTFFFSLTDGGAKLETVRSQKLVFRGAAVENFTHERLIFLLSSIGYIAGKLSRSGAMLVELVVFNSLLELAILLLATFE